MVGLTLALALDQAGLSVGLVESGRLEGESAATGGGRASMVAFAVRRMWEALGVGGLEGQAQPVRRIQVTEGRLSSGARSAPVAPASMMFTDADLGSDEAGAPLGWMIENRVIRDALVRSVRAKPGIAVFEEATARALMRDGTAAGVQLADGREVAGALLVGAEGRRSMVAETFGLRAVGWDYGQDALAVTLVHETPHDAVAHQLFLPSGPIAVLPMTGNRSNIVWTHRRAAARALAGMDDADLGREIAERVGGLLGRFHFEGTRATWPLALAVADPPVGPRIALVGDSWHSVHPLAGQGLNLGLKDVAALAEVLADAVAVGLDPGAEATLDRYVRWRRFDVTSQALGMDLILRAFAAGGTRLGLLRQAGLAVIDAAAPARRLLARTAGAATGDLPRLLRGERLDTPRAAA